MSDNIGLIINLVFFLVLILLGYFVGSALERSHYRSIREREKRLLGQPMLNLYKKADPNDPVVASQLVMGSAVVSIDYFKRFVAGLINFFGGRVTPYESLVDRARREAVLRMQEQAIGMDAIINVRVETSSISKGRNQKSVGCVEAFAYGTALKYEL